MNRYDVANKNEARFAEITLLQNMLEYKRSLKVHSFWDSPFLRIKMHLLPSLTAALFALAVSAKKPGQVAKEHSCGPVCQANPKQTNAADLKIFDTSFDFDFYATANNFSSQLWGRRFLNGCRLLRGFLFFFDGQH